MTALTGASATTVSSSRTQADHVVADAPTLEPRTARIAALIDPVFLAEVGWDPVTRLLSPPAGHPLLGRPVCRAAGCAATATRADRVCVSCRVRLATAGLDAEQLDQLAPRSRPSRGPWPCVVDGCRRTWESARTGLCRTHQDLARSLNVDADQFLVLSQAQPLPWRRCRCVKSPPRFRGLRVQSGPAAPRSSPSAVLVRQAPMFADF